MSTLIDAQVAQIRQQLIGADALDTLRLIATEFTGKAAFSTSFGLEDQVIAHLIFAHDLPIEVFTLDTGRNFQETYATWSKTVLKYGKTIRTYYPNHEQVAALVERQGPNGFYESVDARKACCNVRKVEPLSRALAGKEAWVTGIRAEQSATRTGMQIAEFDATYQLLKVNPLLDWTWEQTWAFIREYSIPHNPLHLQGFVSIGCAPCTRAVKPGEDFRAGRWWWEDQSAKECGLHASPPGPLSGGEGEPIGSNVAVLTT
ncbi:phosphoadenylyl-sulfate reductase [Hymenobacter latericus]|uniref:phosphoadenylyl-sulfate reductase n=1 Tax=Hymenobacter sp. YIM 151858-1 TaxID=2987688 RepID=UPI0022272659|nr:phosphoadenylyl-sulfate reductase [Hymenobacter sp. YIM 151858-1]UYZ58741.1 phosphoadenylyl-sulfate reductase [Hymenobacter sp. YIM 151858-1]